LFTTEIVSDKSWANLPSNIEGITNYTTYGLYEYIVFLDELTQMAWIEIA
jgi:hypothetical protein